MKSEKIKTKTIKNSSPRKSSKKASSLLKLVKKSAVKIKKSENKKKVLVKNKIKTIKKPNILEKKVINTSINLDDFLLTGNKTFFDVKNESILSTNEHYDLERSILEYNNQVDESVLSSDVQEKTETMAQKLPSNPLIKFSVNSVRSSYLVNLSTSKITHQDEEIVKQVAKKKEVIFEQPKKKLNFKRSEFSINDWFKNSSNNYKHKYIPASLKFKMVLQFTAVILLLILPLRVLHVYSALGETKSQVMGVTELGVEGMKTAAEALGNSSWNNAVNDFNKASESFNSALSVLQQINETSLNLAKNLPIVGSTFNSAQNLLDVGKTSADLAAKISILLQEINGANDKQLTEKIVIIKQGLVESKEYIEKIDILLKDIDPNSVPENYRPQFQVILNNLPILEATYSEIDDFVNFIEKVMGFDAEKRYLFIFQNNNEIRATGGFMGSFALVDIKKGEIVNMEIPGGGFYDLKASFFEKIISPAPFHLVGYPWGSWDSNWWPDFSLSADKIEWFLEKSRWPSVDGVIAFNADLIPKLINLTGEIELPKYDKKMTADNVILALQHAVEFEYDKVENKPKQIIGDMMPILVERLFEVSEKNPLPLVLSLHDSLKNRDIQMHFNEPELQSFVDKQDWSGKQKQRDDDYLMVVNSNIAGGKTDNVVRQTETLYTNVEPDGSVIHTLAITRTHNGNMSDVFERVNNVSHIRVYTPENSELIEVTGANRPDQKYFKEPMPGYKADEYLNKIETDKSVDEKSGTDVYKENNKKVFGNWLQVEPGQSSTLTITYRVPANKKPVEGWKNWFNKLTNKWHSYQSYSFYWQRQSGSNTDFEHQLTISGNKKIIWNDSSGKKQEIIDDKLLTSGELDSDVIIAVIFEKS